MNIPLIDQEYILKPFGMVCASLLELELQARCHSSYLFSLIFMDMLLMSIDISIKIVPKKKKRCLGTMHEFHGLPYSIQSWELGYKLSDNRMG